MEKNIEQKNKQAFTLIELLISMSVMGVIMIILGQLMITSFKVNYKLNARQQIITDIDTISKVLTYNVQSAESTDDICTQEPGENPVDILKLYHVRLEEPVIAKLQDTDFELGGVVLNSDETEIVEAEYECTQVGFNNQLILVTLKAKPKYGMYKDEVFVVRQISITTETFEAGY